MNIPGINTSPEVVAQQVERLRLLYGRAYFVADMLEAIAAELIAARVKLAAAKKLAEAVKHYRDFILDHAGSGEVVPIITEPAQRLSAALAAWEAAK